MAGFEIAGRSVTYREAYGLLAALRDRVFGTDECPHGCLLVDGQGLPVGGGEFVALEPMEGDVQAVAEGASGGYCRIGAVGVRLPDGFFDEASADEPVDAFEFVGSAIAILHERRHVQQHQEARRGGTAYADVMYLAHLAGQGNPDYAWYNYYTDPTETDAQYAAVLGGYRYLSDLVGPAAADAHICAYQEARDAKAAELRAYGADLLARGEIDQEAYDRAVPMMRDFIEPSGSGRYAGASDVIDRYRAAFEASVSCRRIYPDKAVENGRDSLALYFQEHPRARKRFVDEKDGYEALKIAVNIHMESDGGMYEPGLFGRNRPKFDRLKRTKADWLARVKESRGLDLSNEATITKPAWKRMLAGSREGRAVAARAALDAPEESYGGTGYELE